MKYLPLIAAAALAVGCSTSAEVENPFNDHSTSETRMAAFAAKAEYPGDAKAQDIKATALISQSGDKIQIINASDQSLKDVNVWLDGRFVAKVNSIPASSTISLDRSRFYDDRGTSLSDVKQPISRVEIESGGTLYRLQGPVAQ